MLKILKLIFYLKSFVYQSLVSLPNIKVISILLISLRIHIIFFLFFLLIVILFLLFLVVLLQILCQKLKVRQLELIIIHVPWRRLNFLKIYQWIPSESFCQGIYLYRTIKRFIHIRISYLPKVTFIFPTRGTLRASLHHFNHHIINFLGGFSDFVE